MTFLKWTPSFLLLTLTLVTQSKGHGYILSPAARGSKQANNLISSQIDYDVMSLFCGGASVHYNDINKGRCGECGDAHHIERPRPHEFGGRFTTKTKTVVQKYEQGDDIMVQVRITASHKGFFEFRLCPLKTPDELATWDCLNKNQLVIRNPPSSITKAKIYFVTVQLPGDVACEWCVFQWKYVTGNSPNTTNVETFINCADIRIYPKGQLPLDLDPLNPAPQQDPDSAQETDPVPAPAPSQDPASPVVDNEMPTQDDDPQGSLYGFICQQCVPNTAFEGTPGIADWCLNTCMSTSKCSPTVCELKMK